MGEGAATLEMKWTAKSNKTKSGQFGTEAVNTCLNFFELLVGDLSDAGAILTHEAVIDSEIASECADVEHRVILEQRCDVKAKFGSFGKFYRHKFATLLVALSDFSHGVKEILLSFGNRASCADKCNVIAGGVVGDICAV